MTKLQNQKQPTTVLGRGSIPWFMAPDLDYKRNVAVDSVLIPLLSSLVWIGLERGSTRNGSI